MSLIHGNYTNMRAGNTQNGHSNNLKGNLEQGRAIFMINRVNFKYFLQPNNLLETAGKCFNFSFSFLCSDYSRHTQKGSGEQKAFKNLGHGQKGFSVLFISSIYLSDKSTILLIIYQ